MRLSSIYAHIYICIYIVVEFAPAIHFHLLFISSKWFISRSFHLVWLFVLVSRFIRNAHFIYHIINFVFFFLSLARLQNFIYRNWQSIVITVNKSISGYYICMWIFRCVFCFRFALIYLMDSIFMCSHVECECECMMMMWWYVVMCLFIYLCMFIYIASLWTVYIESVNKLCFDVDIVWI